MRRDIYLKIKEHNNFVERELLKSCYGDIINLTELILKKEFLYKKETNAQRTI